MSEQRKILEGSVPELRWPGVERTFRKTKPNSGENSGTIETVTQPHGGALRVGNPGNKGGRPPNEFRDRMAALTTRDDVEAYLERCLKGEFGPKFFLSALSHATDRGYGKAAQPLQHSGYLAAFDPTRATDEQLERISNGEDPAQVLTESMDAGSSQGEG